MTSPGLDDHPPGNAKMRPTRLTRLTVLLSTLAAVGVVARSATAQQGPAEMVRSRNQQVQRILQAHPGDTVKGPDRERLKDVINGLIDFNELSKRALGRNWDARTDAQRAEFVNVFRDLVRASSVRKLGMHRADSVTYRPAQVNGTQATVTTIAWKDRKSAEIVYQMLQVGGEWKAWDVIVDGSSTMRTYRDSFTKEINSSSYDAMFARLKDRLAQEQREG
jgi:phospholipid transport system substrate-binding protein